LLKDLENTEVNSEKIWKIWKKGKSNSDKIWKNMEEKKVE
jgi:hypothetical protein